MKRHDIEFDLTYSCCLERMFSVITGRIDRIASLVTIVAAIGIFGSVSGYTWFGALIALLSVSQVVFQFSKLSAAAFEQAKKYRALITEMPGLADDELKTRFRELQGFDSACWGLLRNAAHKRACIMLGREDSSPAPTLTESVFAWLAGDLPAK